ncbi:Crp/Fnr family transcriptional regulator [Pontixanthobacter gangjinensis]|uniref:Crp/Fnr family transcriptional regulator n=1 Tax=Christiangramia aestuarii TaxID=1028746 RepID=A0A7M3SY11_9FLAO|nr:Crp/Fnr family transcriptional regulator [Christiangramia aestuarii]MUP41492.1 Crp/Fnr family transcriptional regulator [Christiangramia aestuarii]
MELPEFLKSLVDFSEEELEEILTHFRVEEVSKEYPLVEQGQICRKLYYIEKGVGRNYYLNADGKEITQLFFGEGRFMTSLESFFQESPSLYNVEVLEESLIHFITKEDLEFLFGKYHKMEQLGRLLSTEMLTKVVHKLNAIQFQTAQERYEYMLTEYPDIIYRVPLGMVASYLGMSQETLSRIRKKKLEE